jgi:hypothetical protein
MSERPAKEGLWWCKTCKKDFVPLNSEPYCSKACEAADASNDILYAGKYPEQSPENFRRALRKMGITVSYDAFACHEVIEGLDGKGYGPELDDGAIEHLYLHLWQWFQLKLELRILSGL